MNIKNFSTVTGLFLGVFVVGVDSFIISPLLPQIAQDFHATISQTALGVTTYALCEMIGAPLFGPLGDRFSKRKLLITGMSLFLGATLLCAIATNLATFYIYRAAAGLGAALFLPNVWAFIGSYFNGQLMNKIMGISMAGLSLSVAVGVPLGSFLSQLSNWHSAFWASAVLTVFSLILIIAIIPNTTAQNQKISYLVNFRNVFKAKNVIHTLLLDFFWMFGFYLVYTFLGSFLAEHFHFSSGKAGLVFLIYGTANFIAASTGGVIMNKLGRVKSILFNACASLSFTLALGLFSNSILGLIIFLILLAFSMGWGVTAISAYLVTLSTQNRSTLMSFNSSALYLGLTLASIVGGLIYQGLGFWILGIISSFSYAIVILLIKELH